MGATPIMCFFLTIKPFFVVAPPQHPPQLVNMGAPPQCQLLLDGRDVEGVDLKGEGLDLE